MALFNYVISSAIISLFLALTCVADDLTLDQALESALNNSPLVAEINSTLAQKEREARDIAILPNPEIDAEQQFYARGAPDATKNQPSVNLIQPFRLSHLGLRDRVANLKEEAARKGREVELLGFVQRVRFAFAHLWLLNKRKGILEDINKKASKVSQFIEEGFKVALFGRGEQAVFDAEVARIAAELQGLNAEIARANGHFIGITGISTRNRSFAKPIIMPAPANLVDQVKGGSLKIQKQMDLLNKVATESLRLAERDSFPELRPRLVYAGTNDGGEFYGVGITFQLPFWNRNQNAIHAASAEKQAAERSNRFYQSPAFEDQIWEIQSSITSSLSQLEIYEKKVLPGYQSAFDAFDEQLRAGQGATLQLWQTLISLNENSTQFSELWAKTFSERAELGILLQEDI